MKSSEFLKTPSVNYGEERKGRGRKGRETGRREEEEGRRREMAGEWEGKGKWVNLSPTVISASVIHYKFDYCNCLYYNPPPMSQLKATVSELSCTNRCC